jgi:hypothetical protein
MNCPLGRALFGGSGRATKITNIEFVDIGKAFTRDRELDRPTAREINVI